MTGWLAVLVWWLAFAAGHLVLSAAPVRGRLIGVLGERLFQGLYSLMALATFVGLAAAYWNDRNGGPPLWDVRTLPVVRAVALALAASAVVLLVPGLTRRAPSPAADGTPKHARGLTRITRHPLFFALSLWGLAHALVSSTATDLVFFAGFPLFAVVGGWHQDARTRASRRDLAEFYRETSFVPFGAIVVGRNRLVVGELSMARAGIGVAVAAVLYLLHGFLRPS